MVNSMMPFQALQDGWISFSLNKEITKFGDMWFWQVYVWSLCICLEKTLKLLEGFEDFILFIYFEVISKIGE